ncbi:MAG: response regulator transcription factor [Syntrophaceae bacterium]|nr:response regulator transcription factor [Syntrophaceae bacterium]
MQQGRVILADKHPNVLGGIRRLLEAEVETVLMVADEISLMHALEHHNPDVVIADLSLQVSTKTNIAWELKKKFPQIKVIILSNYDDRSVVDEVMASGIEGYVLKQRAVIDLIPAVRDVGRGLKYISQGVFDTIDDKSK